MQSYKNILVFIFTLTADEDSAWSVVGLNEDRGRWTEETLQFLKLLSQSGHSRRLSLLVVSIVTSSHKAEISADSQGVVAVEQDKSMIWNI